MRVYSGKDRKCVPGTVTAIHATGTGPTSRIETVGHKLYMDFFSPDSFDDLHHKTMNSCGTIRPHQKGMPQDFGRN